MPFTITSRAQWGARPPRDPDDVRSVTWRERTQFVVHHTQGPTTQDVRLIQDLHMDDLAFNDIGYNFLVRDDGRIYEGRGWLVVGTHADDHNVCGIGCAYIGRGDATESVRRSIRWLYDQACAQAGRPLDKRGHGQLNPTDCPGAKLQTWIDGDMPVRAGAGRGWSGEQGPDHRSVSEDVRRGPDGHRSLGR